MSWCIFTELETDDGVRRVRCADCGLTLTTTADLAHIVAKCPGNGPRPGGELRNLLAEFGLVATVECGCEDKARQMDQWGIAGCKEHRAEIVSWLHDAATSKGWLPRLAAGVGAGRLVDEAIRRAEASKKN